MNSGKRKADGENGFDRSGSGSHRICPVLATRRGVSPPCSASGGGRNRGDIQNVTAGEGRRGCGVGRERGVDSPRPSPNSSLTLPNIPRERLPKNFLADSGLVKPRPLYPFRVPLYLYGPYNDRGKGSQSIVGDAYYEGKWREYTHVEFKGGIHYLRIRLTNSEISRQAALDRDGTTTSRVVHGWATFERTDAPPIIPDGKDYLCSQFYVHRKPTVLLNLFDGIGGGRVAIEALEDRYTVVRSFSSEIDKAAKIVVKHSFPDTVDLGSVDQIHRHTIARRILGDKDVDKIRRCAVWDDEVHFLVIAGPPCQNSSQAKAVDGLTEGVLDGEKSRMFFHVPRIVKYLTDALAGIATVGGNEKLRNKKIVHFVCENVEMSNRDRMIFHEFLGGVEPWKIDLNEGGCCASLMSRRRLYWCSLMPMGGEVGFEAFRKTGCAHPALAEGKHLDDVLAQHDREGYEFCNKSTGRKVHRLPTLTRFIKNKGQDNYYIRPLSDLGKEECRSNERMVPAPEDINEDLLGFPVGHTKIHVDGKPISEKRRRMLLGNTFMVFHMKYLLLKMHHHTDLVKCKRKPVAFITKLPLEFCQEQIHRGNDIRRYRKIMSVLTNELQFDDMEQERPGPILHFFKRNELH
mmetsp:Transcript_27897/g.81951  ORF Transcript_27897/g.81951 Transcript_27897/m.81951 type:complete len:631 (-) Transcript_27897:164-2056(-)